AVDNQPWSGEANVHVSIVNSVKTHDPKLLPQERRLWFKVEAAPGKKKIRKRGSVPAHKDYELDFRTTPVLNSALSDRPDLSTASRLRFSTQTTIVCQGVTPGHAGFVLSPAAAKKVTASDALSRDVVFPYLVGRDLLTGTGVPTRDIIDFGQMSILEAQQFRSAFRHVESHVLPEIENKAAQEKDGETARNDQLGRWWMHWRSRRELIRAISKLDRFLVCSRVTKRPIFVFVGSSVRPGDSIQVFAFDDDYSFGILHSIAHWQWFVAKCSKLTERFRYTPESVFDTFPWPQSPTAVQVTAVAAAGREVRRVRDEALTNIKGGLRAVYRTLELPGRNPLKEAHAALDAAVLAAYGFSAKKDLLAQLLELNHAVAARIAADEPVTAPGIPPGFPHPEALVTDDCIRPE
ncbi:MAG: type IIL restriction-modification enzyme MmeI, partial [Planctomycetales bacterium]